MSGYDALDQLTCCSQSIQTETKVNSRCLFLEECNQAESGNVTLWFTAQMHDGHWGTYGKCTYSDKCSCLCGNFHIMRLHMT